MFCNFHPMLSLVFRPVMVTSSQRATNWSDTKCVLMNENNEILDLQTAYLSDCGNIAVPLL